MKVVLKETVYDRIKKKLYEAQYQRREVDYILVTPDEWCELMGDPRQLGSVERKPGLTLNTKRFASQRAFGGSYAAYSDYTFQGIDLFVVPEEFHHQ